MDSLPRLIPFFPNVGVQNLFQQKSYTSEQIIFPDNAGAGVDVTVEDGVPNCKNVKCFIDEVGFGSKLCALPFMHPNYVKKVYDPCLEDLQQQKKNLFDFCTGLKYIKNKIKRYPTYRNAAVSSYNNIKTMLLKEKFDPVSVHESIIRLAQKYPVKTTIPEENYSFMGGSLTTLNTQNEFPVLLHPSGKKLNSLAITPLKETQDAFQSFQPVISNMHITKLAGGKIFQIVSQTCGICYVRQKHYLHFVNIGDDSKQMMNIPTVLSFEMQDEISCIAASPYIPSECAVISETGLLSIQNVEKKKAVWQSNYFTHISLGEDTWWSCGFGSHPRSVLYMDSNHLMSIDARTKKFKECLLLSSSSNFLLPDEKFIHIEKLHTNNYQHLVTAKNCLLVCDERYPRNTVMTWNHMLNSNPLYCKSITYNTRSDASDVVVLIGSQSSKEIVSFFLQSSPLQVQPISISQPLYLSSPIDCFKSLKLHGVRIDDKGHKRLDSPLIGVCAAPHTRKIGFTAFQLTSFGDLFFQDFNKCLLDSEITYRSDAGCVLCPPSRFEPHLSKWLEDAAKIKTNKRKKEYDIVIRKKKRKKVSLDITELFDTDPGISRECTICSKSEETSTELTESCSSCGLDTFFSSQLRKHATNSNILSHMPSVENLNVEMEIPALWNALELSQFSDRMSINIRQQWLDENQEDENFLPNIDEFSMASSLDSSVALSTFMTPQRDLDAQSPFPAFENGLSKVENSQMSNFSIMDDDDDDMIPPSQEVRSVIGEILRTPKKNVQRRNMQSSAGF